MNKTKKYFLIFLLAELFFSYTLAFAADPEPPPYTGVEGQIKEFLCTPTPVTAGQTGNPNSNDLFTCINKLYKFAIIIACVVGVFFIVIAGYVYMGAEGNQESVEKAKSILTSTLTSIVILFAGYILLRAINPDLIQFRSIQPPNAVLPPGGAGGGGGGGVYTGRPSNHNFSELPGCAPQTPKQTAEIGQLTEAMFQKLKQVCLVVKNESGTTAQISGIVGLGEHAANSLHYRGCAVDFAGGGNSRYTSQEPGISIMRISGNINLTVNPGSDAGRTDIVHIDLGSACPS